LVFDSLANLPVHFVQLIKFTQKKCSSKLPKMKSANARSCDMFSKWTLFSEFVWMRSEAVRTN
jgi:hypothetical protein